MCQLPLLFFPVRNSKFSVKLSSIIFTSEYIDLQDDDDIVGLLSGAKYFTEFTGIHNNPSICQKLRVPFCTARPNYRRKIENVEWIELNMQWIRTVDYLLILFSSSIWFFHEEEENWVIFVEVFVEDVWKYSSIDNGYLCFVG